MNKETENLLKQLTPIETDKQKEMRDKLKAWLAKQEVESKEIDKNWLGSKKSPCLES